MIEKTFPLAAALIAALPVFAQVTTQKFQTLALTHKTPLLVRQSTSSVLGCPGARCLPQGFETRQALWAGGTAYNGRRTGTWISNGSMLALVDPDNCTYLCKPQKAPLPAVVTPVGRRVQVTGLAFIESGSGLPKPGAASAGWLFMSDSMDNVSRLEPVGCLMKPKWCSWSKILGNPTPGGGTRRIGGLATDDRRRLLFVAASNWGLTLPGNVIYVARANDFCTPICKFEVRACDKALLGPITGLAFDSCGDMLYVTDGHKTVRGIVTFGSSGACTFRAVGCCPAVGDEAYTGLAIKGVRPVSTGQSCVIKTCNTCPEMKASTVGDPVMGNTAFALTLESAPGNYTAAALGIGLGSCSVTGISLGFCGRIRIPMNPPWVVLFLLKPSPTLCGGHIRVPAGVPVDPVLCHVKLAFQWVVECKRSFVPAGNGVTNCINLEISNP